MFEVSGLIFGMGLAFLSIVKSKEIADSAGFGVVALLYFAGVIFATACAIVITGSP